MSRELRGIKGKDAIKVFLRAGGIERPGKGELKIGLLKSAIHKAGLTEEQFFDLL